MNKVPRVILPVLLALGLLFAGCSNVSKPALGNNQTEGTQIGNTAPDFQLQSLTGQTFSLENLRGKPVLINFWATWCPPCRGEMPYIQEIYEEWSGNGLVVMAINIGESSSTAEGFMQSNGLSFTVLLDTRQNVAEMYNISGIPTTLFIDKDGIIQDKVIGAFPNKTQIENRLSKIMP